MNNPPTPADWQRGPLPLTCGWFAVLRCFDPDEGVFPDTAWVHHGRTAWPSSGGLPSVGNVTYAGPFPTEEDARAWADAHDVM